MSAIERDERSGRARDPTKHGRSLPSRLRRCGSPPHLRTRCRQWCPICRQATGRATRCPHGQRPDWRAVECGSRLRLHISSSPPERECWNSGKPAPSKSSAPRLVEHGSGESPERKRSTASCAPALKVSGQVRVWLPWTSPTPGATLSIASADRPGIRPGSITWAPWLGSEPFRARIGSQCGKRTRPGSRRKAGEAPETRLVREPRSQPNNW